jgi:hypothetical protein
MQIQAKFLLSTDAEGFSEICNVFAEGKGCLKDGRSY